ncbi:MAG: hypothetical protein QN193_02400 [Armatimonadota bacterium]|nr:hypothetical protein [Armatimonadota bacterium]MDR7440377.1 hypothetical protein [Armatimonadota bacterium]MDR7444614.1 hypothetical protein [Armatimonadota bacterium]MDR7569440.1 hypothetical protein [Armatimonadota bacterium]MDR7613677.1 hypothetical protein [Armatimonadota bacterium]
MREVTLSEHARRRCQQRGVRPEDLEVALKAKPAYDQGDLVYRITDRLLLRLGLAREADRLRGLTVVVGREGLVRTVKWDSGLRQKGLLRRSQRGRLMSRGGRRLSGSEPRDLKEQVG